MIFRFACSNVMDSRDGDEIDASSPPPRAYRLLVRGVRWLREFNRGHAGTSHLPHRDE
jgi:hypothetical protein